MCNNCNRLSVILLCLALLPLPSLASGLATLPFLAADSTQPGTDCRHHLIQKHKAENAEFPALAAEIAAYQELVEQALTYRHETIAIGRHLKQKISREQPLTGTDLDRLNTGTLAHLKLRQQLWDLATLHECWLDLSDNELADVGLTPQAQFQGIMVSLSAALILYDNYLLAISLFEEDDKLRRVINKSDIGYKLRADELAKITLSYNSIDNRKRVRRAIYSYEEQRPHYKQALATDPAMKYLDLLIQQSPSYDMTKRYSPLYVLGRKLEFFSAITGDTLSDIGNEGINLFSMLFGNTVGLIESRHGKLYHNEKILKDINSHLSTGDILLEKTPFRLTDNFIPGHWGHAALWIGNEQELRELGIWEHELVKQHHDAIRHGQLIVEALRSGVEMNTLEHFSNVDDLAVLRDPHATKDDKAEIILQALRQIGKAYDFNFDVETTDRIVCSELIYLTYTKIDWPTDMTLGRATISPDNIAQKSINGGQLSIVMLFHDGQLVSREPATTMAMLLRQ